MTDYNNGKWHGWNGGECPVHHDSVVDVVFDAKSEKPFYTHNANNVGWINGECPSNIIAFRVTKAHKEPREFWMFSHSSGSLEVFQYEQMCQEAADGIGRGMTVIKVREVKQ